MLGLRNKIVLACMQVFQRRETSGEVKRAAVLAAHFTARFTLLERLHASYNCTVLAVPIEF